VIKIENYTAAFSQALPNGLRYEVIKNMNERDDINLDLVDDIDRAKLNYSARYRTLLTNNSLSTCKTILM